MSSIRKDKVEWQMQYKVLSREVKQLMAKYTMSLRGYEDLTKEWRDYNSSYDDNTLQIRNKLQRFKIQLDAITRYLQDTQIVRTNTNELQIKLESFEGKLSSFKSRMREDFEGICQEEVMVTQDLAVFESKCQYWDNEGRDAAGSGRRSSSATRGGDNDNVEEAGRRRRVAERNANNLAHQAKIGAIDRKLAASGGRCGGWDSRDHDVFLRAWTQTVDRDLETSLSASGASSSDHTDLDLDMFLPVATRSLLLRRLVPMLPGTDEEDINGHINWYCMMLSLQTEKKKLLDRWRSDKLVHSKANNIDPDQDSLPMDTARSGCSGTGTGTGSPSSKKSLGLVDDRASTKERVAAWRRQREEEEERRKKEAAREEEEEKRRIDDLVRKRQQSSRLRLQQMKQQREEVEDRSVKTDKTPSTRRSSSVDPGEIRRRAARDLEIAKQKLEQREAREREDNERELKFKETLQRQQRRSGSAHRDPSRLLAPTNASRAQQLSHEELDMREQRRASGGAHSANVALGGYDLKYCGRAIPSWCQALR
eukprot:gene1083-2111_t